MTPGKCQPFAGNAGDFSSSTASAAIGRKKGEHRFCPLRPAAARYFLPLKHSPDFSGIQSESVPALRPTARPHIRRRHVCLRPYRNALSPVAPFSAKSCASVAPPICSKTIFRPVTCSASLYKFQNLRIILTHNHRRRCGKRFIADARSARFPQIFCQIFNR